MINLIELQKKHPNYNFVLTLTVANNDRYVKIILDDNDLNYKYEEFNERILKPALHNIEAKRT